MEVLLSPEGLVALVTLTILEIVLGIDNIIFISIISDRLPEAQRKRAQYIGLALALFGRVALLLSITWVLQLTEPLWEMVGRPVSGRDLILFLGGLFLLYKSTVEMHHMMEGPDRAASGQATSATFGSVIGQILVLDLVFSLDSVITAVGMVDEITIMITAIVIAIIVMILGATAISEYVRAHPTMKTLALAFLLMVGVALIAEAFHLHIPRGYVYFAMAFSVGVELVNMRVLAARRAARGES